MRQAGTVCGRWPFILLIIPVVCIACTCVRPLPPANFAGPGSAETCRLPFPASPYRFIHAVEALPPGGARIMLVGVTIIDPRAAAIRSVIMTIEGLVLFDAAYDKEVTIHRALPPFDNKHFAGYMLEDVRLIYFPPRGTLSASGLLADGSTVCRYAGGDGMLVDVTIHPDQTWEIGSYASSGKIMRSVKASALQDGFPGVIELSVRQPAKYFLRLKLISAEPVSPGEVQ
ncbi:MAG: hypothetical protein WCQ99_08915 [Pseudomonadota bacterium]